MSSSRWHEGYHLRRCEDCINTCNHFSSGIPNEDSYKRSMTLGPVRYGLRTVSPPPPGAGPRYCSKCCWPGAPPYLSAAAAAAATATTSRTSMLPTCVSTPINSPDIISNTNKREDAASTRTTSDETPNSVRDSVPYPSGCLLKKHYASVKSQQFYAHFTDYYGEVDGIEEDIVTLDRLPRFRFGGNRAEKRASDKFRELTERLKRSATPVPPPRRHTRATPPFNPDISTNRNTPLPMRSASFSQVDYCTDDNKYIRRNQEVLDSYTTNTLPRPKNFLRIKSDETNTTELSTSDQLTGNPSVETYKDIPTVQVTSESPEKSLVRSQDNSCINQDKRRDKLKRRKGIYLSQWPTEYYSNNIENTTTTKYDHDNLECECEKTTKLIQEPLTETEKKSHGETVKDIHIVGSSPQEEPLSPEDNNIILEWPKSSNNGSKEVKDSLKVSISKINNVFRSDSLSEGEIDSKDQISLISSDISDGESKLSVSNDSSSPNIPRRYSKKQLKGPYGQMFETEMKKPESRKNMANELKFLDDLPSSTTYKKPSKHPACSPTSCNSSIDETYTTKEPGLSLPRQHSVTKRKVSADNLVMDSIEQRLIPIHHRTTSSPSKLEGLNIENSSDFLEQLLRGSSEQLATKEASQQQFHTDTRNHILVELYDNEKIYVESLESIITNYWDPMKRTDSTFIDANVVDEIFCEVPALLKHHTSFFQNLKLRLEHWDAQQIIGDIFLEMLSIPELMENYINYVNSWKRSRDIIKLAQTSKPQFAKFLESASKNISGKLTLDSLLIKPIQKFPKYELLLQRLIKNTSRDHPDYDLLVKAEKEIHELLVKLNCTEKDALDLEQLREIESAIEGVMELVSSDRQYIRHDIIIMSQSGGQRKERALFLFSDLLLITGIKRRSGSVPKKCHTTNSIIMNNLDGYKYKLIMKIALDDVDIVRSKDDNLRQLQLELENLNKDISILNKITEMSSSLNCSHSSLDDLVKDMLSNLSKNLHLQQNTDIQMSVLDLTLVTQNGVELVNIVFPKAEIRFSWEEALNECKAKLGNDSKRQDGRYLFNSDKGLFPELLITVPVRKTRAGLQFTCAASTAVENSRDVWVCNSDGHVGQICVLTFEDNLEVNITSCNGVCNTRIVCILAVPGPDPPSTKYSSSRNTDKSEDPADDDFESSYSDDDNEEDNDDNVSGCGVIGGAGLVGGKKENELTTQMNDIDKYSTMWLGTEEGTVFIYNANSKVRMRKNRIKIQLASGVLSIVYIFDRVFISEASGIISVYERDGKTGWNSNSCKQIVLGNYNSPITKMLVCRSKLICSCGNILYVMNPKTYEIEQSFVVSNNELSKPIPSIPCIFISGNLLWMSLPNCAIIRCYNATTFDLLTEINVAPAVQKMLICYDNIIRQHKSACLRVTALVQCKDILWIGTSAGILLTIKVPHVNSSTTKLASVPQINGIAHGHTGQVRVLTAIEIKGILSKKNSKTKLNLETKHHLVISGGDGFEDFKIASTSDGAGREDSTNYLLFWTM